LCSGCKSLCSIACFFCDKVTFSCSSKCFFRSRD
jgi:SWI/SNF related-matrix-associated actin-dependent regulator of chromatin subfamily C